MKLEAVLAPYIPQGWSFRVRAFEQAHVTMPLCIDVLPKQQEIIIDSKPRTGASAELQSGYLYRHFLNPSRIEAVQVSSDLERIEADCQMILKGYHAEQLWSGDWFCRWTPEAWSAAGRLCQCIETCIVESN